MLSIESLVGLPIRLRSTAGAGEPPQSRRTSPLARISESPASEWRRPSRGASSVRRPPHSAPEPHPRPVWFHGRRAAGNPSPPPPPPPPCSARPGAAAPSPSQGVSVVPWEAAGTERAVLGTSLVLGALLMLGTILMRWILRPWTSLVLRTSLKATVRELARCCRPAHRPLRPGPRPVSAPGRTWISRPASAPHGGTPCESTTGACQLGQRAGTGSGPPRPARGPGWTRKPIGPARARASADRGRTDLNPCALWPRLAGWPA